MSGLGKINFALACLLVIFTGCSSAPRAPLPDGTFTPEPELAVPTNAVPKPSPTPSPSPSPAILPAPLVKIPAIPFDYSPAWISLERWCRAYGYALPRRQGNNGAVGYYIFLTNGSLRIQIGSQMASWRGAEFRLGFPPQSIDGHPYVTSLDLRKNFLPLVENQPWALTNHVIVIDPGHGGADTGTHNVLNGRFEKEYTLDWARRLQALLATNGWTVYLTRTNDTEIKLKDRVGFADEHRAAIFISLHFNSAYPDQQENGLETYCLTPRGMPSNLTRGFRDDASLTFPNNQFDAENLQLAAVIHRELLKVNGHADRGLRRARFLGVLQGQNRPAVLIEGGYLSNPGEARRLTDPAYREKLAEAVAYALQEIAPWANPAPAARLQNFKGATAVTNGPGAKK